MASRRRPPPRRRQSPPPPRGLIRIIEDDPIRSVTDSSGATWLATGLCCSPDTPFAKGKPMRVWTTGVTLPAGTTVTVTFMDGRSMSFEAQYNVHEQ
jgi:hypothetical protein